MPEIKILHHRDRLYEYYEAKEETYYYVVCYLLGVVPCEIVITCYGISIHFTDKSAIHTNIVPGRVFPKKTKLKETDLSLLMGRLEDIDFEGKLYTENEILKIVRRNK